MISTNSEGKINYKVVLNAFDTTSWGGSLYNAVFPVDLKTIIRDPNDYKKAYKMTFSFQGVIDANILYTSLYGIHIDMRKNVKVMQSNNNSTNKLYYGILRYDTPVSQTTNRFDTIPSDNDPIYYEDIQNITEINIRVIQSNDTANNNTTYAPAATSNKYICVINFTEV
jgi:hypothetical protein